MSRVQLGRANACAPRRRAIAPPSPGGKPSTLTFRSTRRRCGPRRTRSERGRGLARTTRLRAGHRSVHCRAGALSPGRKPGPACGNACNSSLSRRARSWATVGAARKGSMRGTTCPPSGTKRNPVRHPARRFSRGRCTPTRRRVSSAPRRPIDMPRSWRARRFVSSRPRGLRRKRRARRARLPVAAPTRREPLSTPPSSGSRPRVPWVRPGGALERQDYATARTLFTDARRLYGAAAQAAGVAQEAEARRIDAMVADSRRLFASGELDACLRRLGEVLKLRPEHPAANELSVEAEGRARQVETPAAEPETIYEVRGTDDLERTRLPDEPAPTLSPAGGDVTATAAPSTLADATVLSERTVHAEAPTIVAGPPKMTGAAVADSASEAADVASLDTILLSSPSPSSDAMAAPSERRPRGTPPGENRRRLRRRERSIVVALSAIAVIVLAVIYLPPPR